jgi:hypothetical protein
VIPVCVQPAYRPYLGDLAAAVGPVASEVAGLPGAPVRATQTAALFAAEQEHPVQGWVGPVATLGGSPAVLSMPTGAIALPGSFGSDDAGFIDQIKVEAVHAFAVTGSAFGDPAQAAVEAALLQHAGIPLAAQPNALGDSPWPLPGGGPHATAHYPPPVAAAAQRFAALPASARHAWLATHLGALRAGQISLGQLP